jgi:hypothetical protein
MLVAEWDGVGILRASRDGTRSQFIETNALPRPILDKHRLGVVEALLRHLRGKLTLHASAFAVGERAVAFLGGPGVGKSTACGEICRRAVGSFVADDCLRVEVGEDGVYAEPSGESLWLDGDSRSALGLGGADGPPAKESVNAPRSAARPSRLVAMIRLAFDEALSEPLLSRVAGREDFLVLGEALYRFALFDDDALARDLDQLSKLASWTSVYRLSRPRRLSALGASADKVLGLLERLR